MNITWYFPRYLYIGFKVTADERSVGLDISLLPLFSVSLDFYYAKNFWVKRGPYVYFSFLGLHIESKGGNGELTYDDD
jgi:hypothetical protein